MQLGSGIAIVGIWMGVGIVALSGVPNASVVAIPAMFATIVIALFS
jgi:hypothetical protein